MRRLSCTLVSTILVVVLSSGCGVAPGEQSPEDSAAGVIAPTSNESHVAQADELASEPIGEVYCYSADTSRLPLDDTTAYTWCGACGRGPGTLTTCFPDGRCCAVFVGSGQQRKLCHNRGSGSCSIVGC